MLNYILISTPSHGYLRVPEADYRMSGYKSSAYSYRANGYIYLEEDCDAPAFIRATADKSGAQPEITTEYVEHDITETMRRMTGAGYVSPYACPTPYSADPHDHDDDEPDLEQLEEGIAMTYVAPTPRNYLGTLAVNLQLLADEVRDVMDDGDRLVDYTQSRDFTVAATIELEDIVRRAFETIHAY